MGPEGGDRGGTVIAQGTPEEIIKVKKSYTGYYVKKMLEKDKRCAAESNAPADCNCEVLNSYEKIIITLYENGKNSVII